MTTLYIAGDCSKADWGITVMSADDPGMYLISSSTSEGNWVDVVQKHLAHLRNLMMPFRMTPELNVILFLEDLFMGNSPKTLTLLAKVHGALEYTLRTECTRCSIHLIKPSLHQTLHGTSNKAGLAVHMAGIFNRPIKNDHEGDSASILHFFMVLRDIVLGNATDYSPENVSMLVRYAIRTMMQGGYPGLARGKKPKDSVVFGKSEPVKESKIADYVLASPEWKANIYNYFFTFKQ